MKKAIIFHGTESSPEGNWFRWLEHEMKRRGVQVWVPQLPDAGHPSLREWCAFVAEHCPFEIDADTLLVGHSTGATLALFAAAQAGGPVGAVVAVSVVRDNDRLRWNALDRFFDEPWDYISLKAKVLARVFVHSDNDPYVPLGEAQMVAQGAEGELAVWPGQGHFNLEMGEHYKQFPQLLELIINKGFV